MSWRRSNSSVDKKVIEPKRIMDANVPADDRTVIGSVTKLKGDIEGTNDVSLLGEFRGKARLGGLLFVGASGKFDGEARAKNIVIEGKMTGTIMAQEKIEVRLSGRLTGTVICRQIAIADGAFFEGEVKRESGQEIAPSFFIEKRKELQKR